LNKPTNQKLDSKVRLRRTEASSCWNVSVGDTTHPDLAWAYDFPTRQLLPIAGLVAFYNEKVDITLEGEPLPRLTTHFFK
jgi:Domain of unknown function (DUF427)